MVWIVRDGKNYVSKSVEEDDMTVQETGGGFANIKSARSAIGHTANGELLLLTIGGKSYRSGADLHQMAELMIRYGAQNAINPNPNPNPNPKVRGPERHQSRWRGQRDLRGGRRGREPGVNHASVTRTRHADPNPRLPSNPNPTLHPGLGLLPIPRGGVPLRAEGEHHHLRP